MRWVSVPYTALKGGKYSACLETSKWGITNGRIEFPEKSKIEQTPKHKSKEKKAKVKIIMNLLSNCHTSVVSLQTGLARKGEGLQVIQLDFSEASTLSPMMFSWAN